MKKRYSLFYNMVIFVVAQLLWLMLLGLWIYWYVSNYIIFNQVGDKLSPQIVYDGTNVFALVGGVVLLVAISFSMSLIFRHLNIQLKLTGMYDNFIANVTHELKSPLSSIQLYLETLNTRNVPPEKQKEFYGLMIKDASRLKNLINSILEISALEQKKIAHDYKVFRAGETVARLLNETCDQFKLTKEILTINGGADCLCVMDINAMKIVVDNLVDNAIKYTENNLRIIVNLKENSNKFIMEFSDNGIGIPAGEQKKVFNKFYRIYRNDSPNVKGTGLGLYWVYEILKAHGGKISASSEAGKGTNFKIELPVYHQSQKGFANKLLKNSERAKQLKGS